MNEECMCCLTNKIIANLNQDFLNLNKLICCKTDEIICAVNQLNESMCKINEMQYSIYASLASTNPMAVAAEYPEIQDDSKVVYTTYKVIFSSMLNPKMVILFKGIKEENLPVYFVDATPFEHIVTIGDTSHQALASELVNNYPYPALYVGNYVILNPTEQTMEDFKNGLL